MGFLKLLGFSNSDGKQINDLVLFTEDEPKEESTFSEFYSVEICPKCHRLLDHDKARYKSKCCYKCGHTNGMLFNTQTVIVRDRYVNKKFIETLVHK
jgi:hypothetical protein